MSLSSRGVLGLSASLLLAGCAFLPLPATAQTNSKSDQWIHVRVENKDNNGETVRVNVPIEMAEKILPVINHDNLHNGKIHIDNAHLDDVDCRALLDAVRSAKDGEYVTVQSNENNVRVAKSGGYLYIHVNEKQPGERSAKHAESGKTETVKESKVEIKVPMKVVDALFSAGKDELDIVAALHALSLNGDTELVTVKDDQDTVHVWIDSKNISD